MQERRYLISQVMQRYNFTAPGGRSSFLYNRLHTNGFNMEFIFSILNSFDEKQLRTSEFDAFGIEVIVDYIQRTHNLYLNRILPGIQQHLDLLSEPQFAIHPIWEEVRNAFEHYCGDLKHHIQKEEEKLLPYIVRVIEAQKSEAHLSRFLLSFEPYSIVGLCSNHHHEDHSLSDIIGLVNMYQPSMTEELIYRNLLAQLQAFEEDMLVHEMLEDKVLIPKALKSEENLYLRLSKLSTLN